MILVITDGLCWLPICIAAICSYLGYLLPDLTYVFTACVLLPINSAANPIIYSKYGYDLTAKTIKIIRRPFRNLPIRDEIATFKKDDPQRRWRH